jgi:hypothetical protein
MFLELCSHSTLGAIDLPLSFNESVSTSRLPRQVLVGVLILNVANKCYFATCVTRDCHWFHVLCSDRITEQ